MPSHAGEREEGIGGESLAIALPAPLAKVGSMPGVLVRPRCVLVCLGLSSWQDWASKGDSAWLRAYRWPSVG